MSIKNSKIAGWLSKIGAGAKKAVFVFNGDFAVPAAFCVLLFVLIIPVITVGNHRPHNIDLEDFFKYLCYSCSAGIIISATSVFVTNKKVLHAVCGAAGSGIARALIFAGDFTPGHMIEYWGFIIILCLLFMYVVYSGEKKDSALLYVFAKFVQAAAVCNFIALGLLACGSIFFNFILSGKVSIFDNWYLPICYSFCVCIVGPFQFFSELNTDSAKNSELSKMEKIWYHYCTFTVFATYIFVLYIYFIKIIFLRTLPDGLIGCCVCAATSSYVFMYFSQKQFSDRASKLFYSFGAYLMLPLIFMQCLAIFQRIQAYGLTGLRVSHIGYVLCVLVFIALTFYKKGEHIRKIFIVGAAMVFVLMIQPFSAQRIAILQQTAHFERLLVKQGMLNRDTNVLTPISVDFKNSDKKYLEELNSIAGIYNYLESKKSLPEYCKGKKFFEAFGFAKNWKGEATIPEDFYECEWQMEGTADIKEYGWIKFFRYRKLTRQEEIFLNYCLCDENNRILYISSVDVTGFLIENAEKFSSDKNQIFEIQVTDRIKIVFSSIKFNYDKNSKTFDDVLIDYCVTGVSGTI